MPDAHHVVKKLRLILTRYHSASSAQMVLSVVSAPRVRMREEVTVGTLQSAGKLLRDTLGRSSSDQLSGIASQKMNLQLWTQV